MAHATGARAGRIEGTAKVHTLVLGQAVTAHSAYRG
jgi:hypothetical protein